MYLVYNLHTFKIVKSVETEIKKLVIEITTQPIVLMYVVVCSCSVHDL